VSGEKGERQKAKGKRRKEKDERWLNYLPKLRSCDLFFDECVDFYRIKILSSLKNMILG